MVGGINFNTEDSMLLSSLWRLASTTLPFPCSDAILRGPAGDHRQQWLEAKLRSLSVTGRRFSNLKVEKTDIVVCGRLPILTFSGEHLHVVFTSH